MLREIFTFLFGASAVVVTMDFKARSSHGHNKRISMLEQSSTLNPPMSSLFELNQERMFVLIQLLSQY